MVAVFPRSPAMQRHAFCAAALFFLSTPFGSAVADALYGAPPPNINAYLDKLVKSYPDWIQGYDAEYLILKNGTRFKLSDHRGNKSFEEIHEHPDIDDMFYVPYPAGHPLKNFDPGRVRFEPLFVTMYGDCRKNEVVGKLITIAWLSAHGVERVSITTVNGVDKALEVISRELDTLSIDFMKYLKPPAGTYNCRTVAGSRARSMHAYGTAIDLNPKYSDYWRWSSKIANDLMWKNQIPLQIVRTFERHGFIWGGYWYHLDTMHFEYRPELL
jgi:hypothetical protein